MIPATIRDLRIRSSNEACWSSFEDAGKLIRDGPERGRLRAALREEAAAVLAGLLVPLAELPAHRLLRVARVLPRHGKVVAERGPQSVLEHLP